MSGWTGVDLDGTLAHYEGWVNAVHIGAPVPAMLERVKRWLAEGREVRIFTARVSGEREGVDVATTRKLIEDWCELHVGQRLQVTCEKDFGMVELWDDRAVRVQFNTGKRIGED